MSDSNGRYVGPSNIHVSLAVNGTPCNGRTRPVNSNSLSSAAACSSASSKRTKLKGHRAGCRESISLFLDIGCLALTFREAVDSVMGLESSSNVSLHDSHAFPFTGSNILHDDRGWRHSIFVQSIHRDALIA